MGKKSKVSRERSIKWEGRTFAWCTIIDRIRAIYDLPQSASAGNVALMVVADKGWAWTCKEDILRRRFLEHVQGIKDKYGPRPKPVDTTIKPFPTKIKKEVSDKFYSSRDWRELRYLALRNTDGRCMCCGASQKDGIQLHVDHIKPRSKYPELQLSLSNLQVLCQDCNLGKSNWDDTDWRPIID
jgi:5-methylcytosine-specific restriction endonuclease McrA